MTTPNPLVVDLSHWDPANDYTKMVRAAAVLLALAILSILWPSDARAFDLCAETQTPCWPTSGRPATPGSGTFGYNSTNNTFEGWNGSQWGFSATAPAVIGTGLVPFVQNSITTTATSVLGNPNITVTSATGLTNGMAIYSTPSIFALGTFILNIVGTTVTLSNNALLNNPTPVSVQFGQNRWDTNSNIIANNSGVRVGYFGSAAQGNTTWLNQYAPGIDSGGGTTAIGSIFSLSPTGRMAAIFGTRTSDFTVATGFSAATSSYAINDAVGKNAWGEYIEMHVTNAATLLTFGTEISMEDSSGTNPAANPYLPNPVGGSFNARLDVGTGMHATAALHITGINTGRYHSGIIIGNNTLDTSSITNPDAIAMPQNYAISWYFSSPNVAWKLFSSATALGGTFDFQNAGAMVASATVGPSLTATNTANSRSAQFGVLDNFNAAFNAVGGGGLQLQVAGNVMQTMSATRLLFQTIPVLANVPVTLGTATGTGATAVTGELAFAKIAASGTAPGAGFGKIEFVCGTNPGTAKIIAYAGTSNTPSTVFDNIGAAVTGC